MRLDDRKVPVTPSEQDNPHFGTITFAFAVIKPGEVKIKGAIFKLLPGSLP